MNQDRLLKVLVGPVISEKSTMVAEKARQYTFDILPDATKTEVKAAVELCFKVEVTSVRTVNIKGKIKRTGRTPGVRKAVHKAYVSLKEGQEINFAQEGK